MHLLSFVFAAVLLGSVRAIFCPKNKYLQEFDVAHPIEGCDNEFQYIIRILVVTFVFVFIGSWVSKYEILKLSAGVYNVTEIREQNKMQSVCITLYGQEKCGNSIFDDMVLEFTDEGEVVIAVSYCTMHTGCFCNTSRIVRCCLSPQDAAANKEAKQREAILKIHEWEQNIAATGSSIAAVVPNWSCR
jgi:hypothetical protein